jgi:thiamine-monophosphate kinase
MAPPSKRVAPKPPLGEFELIDRFFRRPTRDADVVLNVGDDAAIVRPTPGCELVLAVDMMVEGRHFLPNADPEALGHKILAVNLSDMAAMGARPRWALLAGALPDSNPAWLEAFARGLFALADVHDVSLIGGDTTRGPLNVCLTIAGEVPAGTAVTRAGAKSGDDIWVSGTLGDAMLGLAALQRRTRLDEHELALARSRLERPIPRIALGERLRGVATAMIDVSDGLTGDLAHIVEASTTGGARIELLRVPCLPALASRLQGSQRDLALACVLSGGDDYELCFTAPKDKRDVVLEIARATAVPLTRVGEMTAERGVVVEDETGTPLAAIPRAFDHFA